MARENFGIEYAPKKQIIYKGEFDKNFKKHG